jgi:hypothetical protein
MKRAFLILVALLLSFSPAFSQIVYNQAKPFSYDKSGTTPLNVLPKIDFPVDADGNYSESDMKINIKDFAHFERIGNKQIARVNIKVHAVVLGEMSIYFRDIILKNEAHCYVYTDDYKIVAGPIYEKSIGKFLSIMSLPANELIFEVVFNNKDDFDMTLFGVNYLAMFATSKTTEQFLGDFDSCHTCTPNVKGYANNVISTSECVSLGHGNTNEIFNLSKLSGINEWQFDAARASCVIMVPNCDTISNYGGQNGGENGTLINFPHEDCVDPLNCEQGFIFTVYHNGAIINIVNAQLENDTDYLEKVIIRFNWHHQYGTPWHLENVNCEASHGNFLQWRNTIDFDEVIDYCGVSVFAYDVNSHPQDTSADFVILRMSQKPFYKELHLGWSNQFYFDSNNGESTNNQDFLTIGRRVSKPTFVIDNNFVSFTYQPTPGEIHSYIFTQIGWTTQGDVFPSNLEGYSGSQLTYYDYNDQEKRIGLGINRLFSVSSQELYLWARTYHTIFKEFDNIKFLEDCYSSYTNIMDYIDTEFSSLINSRNYSYSDDTASHAATHEWYPSVENRHKCPSTQGYDPGPEEYAPCTFDFRSAVIIDSLWVTIEGIYESDFPESKMPKGYRIYYNFGEQKTIEFEEFHDNVDIEFPIQFALDECYLLYMMSLGIDSVKVRIDFYDEAGRILNNSGCDTLEIYVPYTFSLCEKLDIAVSKIDSSENCCTYEVSLDMEACASNNPLLRMIASNLTFSSFMESSPVPVEDLDEMEIDYENGKITFSYSFCDAPLDFEPNFQIVHSKGGLACESVLIDFPPCCNCLSSEDMQSWVEMTIDPDGGSCGEDYCEVSATLNMPDGPNNCFTHYSINHPLRHSIVGVTEVSRYFGSFGCLYKGESRQDTFKFFRGLSDTDPCIVIKDLYCPIVEFLSACTPDCAEVPFDSLDYVEFQLAGCPNCWVKAEYTWRGNTCDTPRTQELQILTFKTYSDPSFPSACETCSIPAHIVHKQSVLQAILQNKMGFLPVDAGEEPDGECDDTWRVITASCWIEFENALGGISYQKCDTTECCSVGLRVCRFEGDPNYITIDTLGSIAGFDSCLFVDYYIDPTNFGYYTLHPSGGLTYHPPSPVAAQCENRCDWLYSLTHEGYSGRKAIDYDVELQEHFGDDDVLIKIKFGSEQIDIAIISEIESDNLQLKISSLEGHQAISLSDKLFSGENLYQINTNDLRTGFYILSIQIDGLLIKTEKYLKVK